MSTSSDTENRLFEWYYTYIGEPDREVDVYLGFALFFAAVGLGVAAFGGAVLVGSVGGQAYALRELAFVLGMVSLPTALAGIVVLLPVNRRGLVGAGAGAFVCLAAVVWFVRVYPNQWSTGSQTFSVEVLFVYSVGLTALLASTGAAMVAYHIDQTRPGPADFEPDEEGTDEEQYTDEEIRRDIEESLEEVDLNWGGVEKSENTALDLVSDDPEFDTSGMQVEVETIKSETGVDEQVDGLKSLKGGDEKTARSESTVDEQTAQLQQLKQRREQEQAATEEGTALASFTEWVAGLLGRR
ncbi:MAG: hypothetical protein V5A44_01520 [Haloarculaceae archaeon]